MPPPLPAATDAERAHPEQRRVGLQQAVEPHDQLAVIAVPIRLRGDRRNDRMDILRLHSLLDDLSGAGRVACGVGEGVGGGGGGLEGGVDQARRLVDVLLCRAQPNAL